MLRKRSNIIYAVQFMVQIVVDNMIYSRYRIQTSIVWRGSREDRFRTHRNNNSEAPTWVRRGPYSARRLKALKANHVWAAGGARAQARRPSGDVLGGLHCLQKNLEAFGAIPHKGKERKRVAFGVVVKNGRDRMTAAKNVGMWHRGVDRGAEALDKAWRRTNLRQSNVRRQREPGLSSAAYMTANVNVTPFLRSLLRRNIMWLSSVFFILLLFVVFCSLFFLCSESLPGDDV